MRRTDNSTEFCNGKETSKWVYSGVILVKDIVILLYSVCIYQLLVIHVVKKLFHGHQRLIIMFTKPTSGFCHVPLQASSQTISLRLILSSRLHPGFWSGFFPRRFLAKTLFTFVSLMYAACLICLYFLV